MKWASLHLVATMLGILLGLLACNFDGHVTFTFQSLDFVLFGYYNLIKKIFDIFFDAQPVCVVNFGLS